MATDFPEQYVSGLERAAGISPTSAGDRPALAALRRSFSGWPVVPAAAMRVVAPLLPEQTTHGMEAICYAIAGLFAVYPCSPNNPDGAGASLGSALAEAGRRDGAQYAERRLIALLNATIEEMPAHLRHAVVYLQANGIRVDYRSLMRDLMAWDSPSGDVQRRWGRDFWRSNEPDVRPILRRVTEEEKRNVR